MSNGLGMVYSLQLLTLQLCKLKYPSNIKLVNKPADLTPIKNISPFQISKTYNSVASLRLFTGL